MPLVGARQVAGLGAADDEQPVPGDSQAQVSVADVEIGVRYWDFELELDPALLPEIVRDDSWDDGYVGLRLLRDLGTDWLWQTRFNVGAGANSSGRKLNIEHIEEATFSFSSGIWIDRDGALHFSATWDHKTDRRLAIDVFPGVISIGGATVGTWFQLDQNWTPYFGITGRRTLGAGIGVGF